MITLYRVAKCAACDDVQEALRELVVAHEVVDVERGEPSAADAAWHNRDLPVIKDGDLAHGDITH